ncbi:MAG: CHASE2 domain-containing protein, partial [Gammaproteobacteria bacterium]
MKAKVWQADWFYAAIVVLLFVLFSQSSPLQRLERDAYDWGVQFAQRDANRDVAIIAIDEPSINNLGRWPWSRDIHAELISKLTDAGAKVVVYAIFFAEDQIDPGLAYIQEIRRQIEQSSLGALPELWPSVVQGLDELDADVARLQAQAS